MKKSLFILSVLLIGIVPGVFCQNKTITGKITSANDMQGMPGVNIKVPGNKQGVQSNTEGQYTIEVTADDKLLSYSFVGYATQEIVIGDKTIIDVVLAPDKKVLEDLVVVGYGTKLTKDLTGSVTKIESAKLVSQSVTSFDLALTGKSAGVQITNTGGTLADVAAIRVRGINSISNNSQPLIVIDGIPTVGAANLNYTNSGNGIRYNPLADINTNDIESIEVLKDAAASAIYGSRAANGVILITTKRGKNGTAVINYDFTTGINQATRVPKLLSGDDFITIQNEKASNRFGLGNANSVIAKESDIDGNGVNDRTDWMKVLMRNGAFQTHNLSMSGGNDKVTYYGSVNYSNTNGILYKNNLERTGARMNIDVTPKSWIKAGVSLNYTKSLNKGQITDSYLPGTAVAGYNAFPTVLEKWPNGAYNLGPTGYLGLGNNITVLNGTNLIPNSIYHPTATLEQERNNNSPQRILSNFYVELQPITNLKITTKYGIDLIENLEDIYNNPSLAGNGIRNNGVVEYDQSNRNIWNWSNYASYTKTVRQNHNIAVTVGNEYQYYLYKTVSTGATNFADPYFVDILDGLYTSTDINTGQPQVNTGGTKRSSGFASYFGRASYSFKNKYYAEVSLRNDAFSGFGADNRHGYFPGVSLAWRLKEEQFMKGFSFLNDLKLRASMGTVGNSNIGEYASRTLYGAGQYANLNGFKLAQAGNPNLKWESSQKYNAGIDAAFLKNRLLLTADYFQNNITDLVLQAPALLTSGVPNAYVITNIGSMYNRGVELTITSTNIQAKDFTWTTSFNFTSIKNKVTKLVDDKTDIIQGVNRASVGRPLGVYKLLRWAGVDPATGFARFYDKNGQIKIYNPANQGSWTLADGTPTTPTTADDEVYMEGKTGLPTWFGGIDNNLSYKSFTFSFSFQYSGGNYILNQTRQTLLSSGFTNNIEEIKNRWQTPGQQTDIPRLYLLDPISNRTSTRWLEKGDFLRLRQVMLSYNLPKTALDRINMSGIRLYIAIQNALVFTKYKGPDPEVNTTRNNNNIAFGLDNRSIPQARTYSFGLNATF